MSNRVKQLAEKESRLQARCAAQRASIANEVASIEARFARVDRIARVARTALLRLVQTIRVFQGLAVRPSPVVRGERL
jgi:hypothetical protein